MRLSLECHRKKVVGEPDEGKPHVRFDVAEDENQDKVMVLRHSQKKWRATSCRCLRLRRHPLTLPSEYDEWFLRQGRYDRGLEWNSQWFQEVEQVRQALDQFKPAGQILELACGTGLWTQQLLRHAEQITAVDAAPEVLKLNQQRLQSSKVKYVQADIFTWQPMELFDAVFFSFWLSHIPPSHFESFWRMVARSIKPGGRVFFVDSRYEPTMTAQDQQSEPPQADTVIRYLNDGREFTIFKVFYKRDQLLKRLSQFGWQTRVYETPHHFIYGEGEMAK